MIRITIDPGHGRTGNPYPSKPGYYEGTQMWKLSQFLSVELQRYGIDVVNTRPNLDDNPEVYDRGKLAGINGSSMFLSLHSNAPADASNAAPTGSLAIYSQKGKEHKVLADRMAAKVSEMFGHCSRGSITKQSETNPANDYYGVIRGAANNGCTCAIIIEHGFHTNPKDAAFLTNDENLKCLAKAESDIIAGYFGLSIQEASNN